MEPKSWEYISAYWQHPVLQILIVQSLSVLRVAQYWVISTELLSVLRHSTQNWILSTEYSVLNPKYWGLSTEWPSVLSNASVLSVFTEGHSVLRVTLTQYWGSPSLLRVTQSCVLSTDSLSHHRCWNTILSVPRYSQYSQYAQYWVLRITLSTKGHSVLCPQYWFSQSSSVLEYYTLST